MKTLKKIFPFFALLCFFGGALSSCDDDCGCDPKVTYIVSSDAAVKDSIIVGANSGEYIVIVGENLASVTEVLFDNTPASISPTYITDNYIILQIPDVSSSTQYITLVTAQGRRMQTDFAINIPAPVITRFYSEFVPDGGTLRIKGNYFFSPKVYFYNDSDELIQATEVETNGPTELLVTVPAGAGSSKPVIVETGSGKTTSKILFRDKRNIIIDFDEFWPTESGTMISGGTGGAVPDPLWKTEFAYYVDQIDFPVGCDGLYDQINVLGDGYYKEGNYISYQVDKGGRIPKQPLIGPFSNYSINDLVLKFEVYVPEEHPLDASHFVLFLPPAGTNGGYGYGRDLTSKKGTECTPGNFWHPFEINIDKTKSDAWTEQIGDQCKTKFFTDGWMTVSVPLSTFKWNVSAMGIYTTMEENFGDYPGSPCLSDVQVLDKSKDMGDFTIALDMADSKQERDFFMFVDNFRIVPDDGSGVQYGKVGQRDIKEGGRPY